MATVTFDSVDLAVRILMTFHNYNIEGRLLKISFLKKSFSVEQKESQNSALDKIMKQQQ